MNDYDAVVIGAGNGGLTSALTLSQRGVKVLLLERHNVPGGCATSFIRGRFEFEVALHQLSGMGSEESPGPLRGQLEELGVLDKVEFVEEDTIYRTVIPGQVDVTLKADRAAIIELLKEKFPQENEAIERFFDHLYEFCSQLLSGVWLKDPEISKEKYPLYFKYALKNYQEVLDEFFEDHLLKYVLSTYWGYIGLPPRSTAFIDLAIILWAYIELKPVHIRGGSQALSNALLDGFIESGGMVRFNCGAKKIEVKNNKITGVITENGERFSTNYVISNASSLTTYLGLIDREHVPEKQLKILGASTIGPSAFSIYTGLDCEPEDLGIKASTSFIGTTSDMDRHHALWRTMEKPETVGFTCYDLADPDFSPPGASQVVLVTLQYAFPWLSVPPTQYTDTKYKYAEHMLAIAEQVYPGFSSPRSSIDGLYFAGAWAGSGGFQPTLTSGGSA
ncbi:MAG: NAD(P)/FAD-dependent oxidoreductase, partial [Deltaproteobacteria bacterium]|nr:NAD(P)/FAD-dependent oxidoreductase [Deltaproteobacteria bacterium]